MKKIFGLFLLVVALFSFSAVAKATSTIELASDNVELEIGSTYQIEIVNKDDYENITYESSLIDVCIVNEMGLIEAKGIGSSIITITANGEKVYLYVGVYQKTTNIKLVEEEATIAVDDTYQINTICDGTETLKYTSSNDEVAIVSDSGLISGVGAGQAEIVISTGDAKTIFTVNVYAKVTEINLEKDTFDLVTGEETTIKITNNILNHQVTYQSNNEMVCTVDQNGNIKAIGAGSAIILVMVDDLIQTVKVSVTSAIPAESIQVAVTSVTIEVGQSYQIVYEVTPVDTTNAISFSSNNPEIAAVDASGLIEGLSIGQTTITLMAGSVTTILTVNVVAPGNSINILLIVLPIVAIIVVAGVVTTVIIVKRKK